MQFGTALQFLKNMNLSDVFFGSFLVGDIGYKPSLATFTGGASQDTMV